MHDVANFLCVATNSLEDLMWMLSRCIVKIYTDVL